MMTVKDKLVFACAMGVMLCGPAIAAPAPSPVGTYSIDLAVHADGETRIYTVKLTDEFCGKVKARVDDVEDEINICTARSTGTSVTLRVDWSLSAKTKVLSQVSSMVVRRGAMLTLKGGAATLDVAIQ
jgi:hypothetical protein